MRVPILIYSALLSISCETTRTSKKLFYKENKQVNLYAFIGRKVSIEELPSNGQREIKEFDTKTGDTIIRKRTGMDNAFNARYEVVQSVFNNIGSDTVRFRVYDHQGRPSFENYEYVLLYLSLNEDSAFYHQKYQFDSVVKREDGFYGQNGKSVQELFENKKKNVFKARGFFK